MWIIGYFLEKRKVYLKYEKKRIRNSTKIMENDLKSEIIEKI